MSKLKMRIVKFEKAIACQILEMDERFEGSKFVASNGFDILGRDGPFKLWDMPTFFPKGVRVKCNNRGNKPPVFLYYFDDDIEREEYLSTLREALKDWAQNWEGFKEDEKSESHNEDDFILEV